MAPQIATRGPRRLFAGAIAAVTVFALACFPGKHPAWLDADAAAAEAPPPGQAFRDCNDGCPEMVVVPAGNYMMGSDEAWKTEPRHRVTIGQPFAVGKFEVTFAEWEACVAGGGCKGKHYKHNEFPPDWERFGWPRGNHAVVDVTWTEAKSYADWLSRKTGKSYRLLTESEWEYVARAGSTTAYSWGDEIGRGNANCVGCGSEWDDLPAPVGSFKPNAFGVHDMHGNVWEWVEDCYNNGFEGSPDDGSARTTDCSYPDDRVQRGGAFLHDPEALRSVVRNNRGADSPANGVGFRIARAL